MERSFVLPSGGGARRPHPAIVQGRSIVALVLREMRTRFGRAKAGYLWALSQPLAQLLFYSVIFEAMGRHPSIGPNNELFVLSGIIPFMTFSSISTRVAQAAVANQALFMFPGVTVLDAAIARALLESATFLVIGLVFFAALYVLDMAVSRVDLAYIAMGVIFAFGLGFGFGLINLAVAAVVPAWEKIVQLSMFPLYFASGVFYLPEAMPDNIAKFFAVNPVMHVISMTRVGLFTDFESRMLSISYVAFWTLSLLVVGLTLERIARPKTIRQ